MGANIYISTFCLLLGVSVHAQKNDISEKPDNNPPAVTIADVEKDRIEANNTRNEYNLRNEELKPNAEKQKKEDETVKEVAVTNTTQKASKKPEKQ